MQANEPQAFYKQLGPPLTSCLCSTLGAKEGLRILPRFSKSGTALGIANNTCISLSPRCVDVGRDRARAAPPSGCPRAGGPCLPGEFQGGHPNPHESPRASLRPWVGETPRACGCLFGVGPFNPISWASDPEGVSSLQGRVEQRRSGTKRAGQQRAALCTGWVSPGARSSLVPLRLRLWHLMKVCKGTLSPPPPVHPRVLI